MQIASQHADRNTIDPCIESVKSMTQSREGDELAPELYICNRRDICVGCKHAKGCPDFDPERDGRHNDD